MPFLTSTSMLLPLRTSSSTNSEWTFITSQPSLMALTWAPADGANVNTVSSARTNVATLRLKYDMSFSFEPLD